MSRRRALTLLALAALGWGGAVAASERAVREMGGLDLLAVELVTATTILWAAQARRPWVGPRHGFALLGLLEPALTFVLVNVGLEHTSASTGSLLVTLESVGGVVFAVAFLRERPERGAIPALALGLGGAVLVALGDSGHGDTLGGAVLVALGALAAAGYVVAARRVAGSAPALAVTTWQFTFATAMCAPLVAGDWALSGGTGLAHAGATALGAALFAGIVGSAGAFVLYTLAAPHLPASTSASTLNLVPAFGLLVAIVVLGDRPGPVQLAGGALCLAGLVALSRTERLAYSRA